MYKKAVTFSFDDGVESDRRLVELFNKYGMKCSFNLNSGLMKRGEPWNYNGFDVYRMEFDPNLYTGHEICAHGLLHLSPTELNPDELDREFSEDIANLKRLYKCDIVGAAYAYGRYDDNVVNKLGSLGIKYCRTVNSTYDFKLQSDMLRFGPTCHYDDERTGETVDRFLNSVSEEPQILYIWGHSYEIDGNKRWEYFENILKKLAGKDDILYDTNTNVFKYFKCI